MPLTTNVYILESSSSLFYAFHDLSNKATFMTLFEKTFLWNNGSLIMECDVFSPVFVLDSHVICAFIL